MVVVITHTVRRRRNCQKISALSLLVFLCALVSLTLLLSIRRTSVPRTIRERYQLTDSREDFYVPTDTTYTTIWKGNELDGCGHDGVTNDADATRTTPAPIWAPSTSEELQSLQNVRQCLRRIDTKKVEDPNDRTNVEMKTLQCNVDIKYPSPIVSQYNRIWFIGDSVLRQQFMALACWIDPSVRLDAHDNGWLFRHSSHSSGVTTFRFDYFGYLNNSTRANYDLDHPKGVIPLAFQTSRQRDAIVLNMGLHYDHTRVELLYNSSRKIAKLAEKAKSSIFFMETPDEQWPTSNGLFTPACHERCQCEALTQQRMQGHGNFSKVAAQDIRRGFPVPRQDLLVDMYPELMDHTNNWMDPKDPFYAKCVPDCIPADWRNRVVHKGFQECSAIRSSNVVQGNVTIVPVWNQLVAAGVPQMVRNGDCTHKSADALLAMNQQLLRSFLRDCCINRPNETQIKRKRNANTT